MKSNLLQKNHTNVSVDVLHDSRMLTEAVENALILSGPAAPIRAVSEIVISENPELIEALRGEWIVEAVSRVVSTERRKLRLAELAKLRASQLALPGFEHVPLRIRSRDDAKPKALAESTHRELRHYLERIRKRQSESARISEVQQLMDLIAKWKAKLDVKHQLTVAEAMEYEAGLRDPENPDKLALKLEREAKKAGKRAKKTG